MSRWSYFARRVLLAVPVVFLGTTVAFLIVRLGPIDPAAAILGAQQVGSPEYYQLREQLGLTDPLWEQYIDFMWEMVTFQLGRSWVISPGTRVNDLIAIYAPRTIWLGFWSVLIALCVGIPLGVYAGLNPNTLGDYVASLGGIVWRAMPNFWLAVIIVTVLSQSQALVGVDWERLWVSTQVVTPPDLSVFARPRILITRPGEAWTQVAVAVKQVAPAALVLGSASMGNEMRIGRTAVLEIINADYIEAARAKGVSSRRLIWKHVFRNALIPLVPIITAEAFLLIGGSVLVETVFAINGLGYLFFQATVQGDLPLVISLMYIFILLLVAANILQDFLYTLIDPRVGYERS
ncbi:ABC transporter permease [Haloplanus sp.]|uniref:ABC transporter permease n=1 Tax=Haloplanus sp. TaxID=1961696 RepID=UPI002620A2E3|nr:ABC transporter permease [Haloplanus sp.]